MLSGLIGYTPMQFMKATPVRICDYFVIGVSEVSSIPAKMSPP